ncbi:hypothetical protein [Siphonobacter aquaeclarae]|uniref:Uncharacterized protein n=1 Tax=Siphonobacter aquaeclarae TaxID=563176 RepID=A0A1G9MWT0_9BACT|nr:hypothetical protein [Siphonobacter aquaeclarae]SDL78481.1 hypothetical protein SAMN04488090_1768 [Siphonobacter aquaeclarae]
MILSDINLSKNPFKDTTPSRTSSLVWAGLPDLKRKIQQCYDECLEYESTQLVLNWGPYGGGKTFSAYYFMEKYSTNTKITQIYLRSPKDGNKTIKEFQKNIIDWLSFDTICTHISQLILQHGLDQFIQLLTPVASSEFAKAISLMGSGDSSTKQLMNRYIYTGVTKSELKSLGLAKDISSDSDIIKFLSGLFACYAGHSPIYSGKLVLWLDEMEDIIYYPAKIYKAFSQVLRDLSDSFSDNLLMFFNFTLAEGEEQTIEMLLGTALWSRITKKIKYAEITEPAANSYVLELLNNYYINPQNHTIDPSIISSIVKLIPKNSLTPREINKYFNSFTNYVLRKNINSIDLSVVNSWAEEFSEFN